MGFLALCIDAMLVQFWWSSFHFASTNTTYFQWASNQQQIYSNQGCYNYTTKCKKGSNVLYWWYFSLVSQFTSRTPEKFWEKSLSTLQWRASRLMQISLNSASKKSIILDLPSHLQVTNLYAMPSWSNFRNDTTPKRPKNIKELHSFIKCVNIINNHIPRCTDLTQPLVPFTNKGIPLLWGEAESKPSWKN